MNNYSSTFPRVPTTSQHLALLCSENCCLDFMASQRETHIEISYVSTYYLGLDVLEEFCIFVIQLSNGCVLVICHVH